MTGEQTAVLATISSFGPTPIKDIARRCALPRRDVEAAVEELRLEGQPIVGGPAGLHMAASPSELAQYVEARRRRLVSVYAGTRALRRTLALWTGGDQQRLFG